MEPALLLGVGSVTFHDAARVDYILVSADLVPRVRVAEILPLVPWSDHSLVQVEL